MIVAGATKVVATALILTLASQCARNMIQTARIAASESTWTSSTTPMAGSCLPSSLMGTDDVDDKATIDGVALPRTVRLLQSLGRPQLLQVFLSSTPPQDLDVLDGEWNGLLLDNNGKIMTAVSNIMTHTFFGRGRRWNGKQFFYSGSSDPGKGINRFVTPTISSSSSSASLSGTIVEKRHEFDFEIQESKLAPGSRSVRLVYNKYHRFLSPWHTMSDELRLVSAAETDVLIGMGCMAWSGGMLNASPFCLWRASPQSAQQSA